MDIEAEIRTYIAKNILFSEDDFEYCDEASFLQEGIVDSIGVLELVAFIEQNYGLAVEDREIVPNNFDSVSRLAEFIRRKVGLPA
jgi:acyl carrier protein